jgi:hypothetical protein
MKRQIAVVICAIGSCSIVSGALLGLFRPDDPVKLSHRTLSFQERVAYQRAIEEVYWRHRIWPKDNPQPKPPLDAIVSQAQLENKVEGYLRKSQLVTNQRGSSITASELQGEMDRMASHTKRPEMLRELFEALGNDPFVIAECLARPMLAERLAAGPNVVAGVSPAPGKVFAAETAAYPENRIHVTAKSDKAHYKLPEIAPSDCTDDAWTATSTTNAPDGRIDNTAVWTGSEMFVWGGFNNTPPYFLNTGGRYNPATDSWTAVSTTNAPTGRDFHAVVWTGSEVIVWGGYNLTCDLNTGGRYNPTSDTWTPTSMVNAPLARESHTAVWTGSEMVVWGGTNQTIYLNTGGRYNPTDNSWTATSTASAPLGRVGHTTIWSGIEMMVWGGTDSTFNDTNSGGRYNPAADSWTATSLVNAPSARDSLAAVWTGSEMIIWGGVFCCPTIDLNTGGRYNAGNDSWAETSTADAPLARYSHTAVWIGS